MPLTGVADQSAVTHRPVTRPTFGTVARDDNYEEEYFDEDEELDLEEELAKLADNEFGDCQYTPFPPDAPHGSPTIIPLITCRPAHVPLSLGTLIFSCDLFLMIRVYCFFQRWALTHQPQATAKTSTRGLWLMRGAQRFRTAWARRAHRQERTTAKRMETLPVTT